MFLINANVLDDKFCLRKADIPRSKVSVFQPL